MFRSTWLLTIVLLCFISPLLQNIELTRAQQNRWYAGYYLFGSEMPGEAGAGALGEEFTLNPSVSSGNIFSDGVLVILQYYPILYWLQIGYTKGFDTGYNLRYFFEYCDRWTYYLEFGDSPSSGSWHTYYLSHPYEWDGSPWEEEWRFRIDGVNQFTAYVEPNRAVDQQAFVETSSSSIAIDGSHSKRLSLFAQGKLGWQWLRWDTHILIEYAPYDVMEIADYEFYANGGG